MYKYHVQSYHRVRCFSLLQTRKYNFTESTYVVVTSSLGFTESLEIRDVIFLSGLVGLRQ